MDTTHNHAEPLAQPNTDLALAQLVGVSKTFGATRALHGVDLSVRAGKTHGLVGRNGAGKSSLVGVFTGLVAPDAGEVLFSGEPAPPRSTPWRWREKVSCVYQHRRLVPTLTVAENLLLNRQYGVGGLISWRRIEAEARRQLDAWELDVNPRSLAADLSVENAQLVEIVRALSDGARFVILDEPTAQLVASGIRRLFREVERLKKSGVTFLFISHHLEELEEICEEVTVLRNGEVVASAPLAEMPQDRIVAAMVGRPVNEISMSERSRSSNVDRDVEPARDSTAALAVEQLKLPELAEPISFEVAAGEIVGLAGQASSGSREVAACLVGLRRPTGGRILRNGEPVVVKSPAAATHLGISYVPEDRHAEGYVPMLSIEDNIAASVLDRLGRWGLVSPSRRASLARRFVADLEIACGSPDQAVGSLSGGNQQKVVMARALASDPEAIVLVHPTAGVDVASKDSLFEAIDRERHRGAAVLLVSDEVDELRRCDRILVLLRGRLVREFRGDWSEHAMVATMEGADQFV